MATNFPSSVDNFTNPTSNDSLNSPSHSLQHANANDAIEAIETSLLPGGSNYPGLVLIKTQTIGTTVSSVTVTSAFSSTYDNYRIVISGGVCSTNLDIGFKLGSTATGYYGVINYGTYTTSTPQSIGTNNGTQYPFVASGDTTYISGIIDVIAPNLARHTTGNGPFNGTISMGFFAFKETSNTQHTDFTLTTSTGTMTGGTIYVYGYRK